MIDERIITAEEIAQLYRKDFGEDVVGYVPPKAVYLRNDFGWMIYTEHGPTAVILWAATHLDTRSKGHAEKNFEVGLSRLKENKFKRVQLSCRRRNTAPQVVALKTGFLVSAIAYNQTDNLEIILTKEL